MPNLGFTRNGIGIAHENGFLDFKIIDHIY